MIGSSQANERSASKPAVPRGNRKSSRLVFGTAIFTSAFLLFQVQLILGKFLLPWFGGTPAVWTTCLLFFQVVLFAGYVYSHNVSTSLRLSYQGRLHLVFLAITALWMLFAWAFWDSPFLPGAQWKPAPGAAPILGILKLLLLGVGLPFLLLSSTGPLLQIWYHQIHHGDRSEPPYFLYALSNAGSLLGLLSYPIVLEPLLGLGSQSRIWGVGFAFFVLCCAACAWSAHRLPHAPRDSSPLVPAVPAPDTKSAIASIPRWWLWFALPALGSVMLLATTNLLTQDVAPIPLLWVLPLCVYLLSFIFTFYKSSWYSRGVFHPLFAITALIAVIALFRGIHMNVFKQVGVFLAMLCTACMICHGELARLKPQARYLTAFYLTLAAGGAFGGIFVGIIAPLMFPAIWEYHIGLWAIGALLVCILFLDKESWLYDPRPEPWILMALFATIFLLPKYLARIGMIRIPVQIASAYNVGLVVVVLILVWLVFSRRGQWVRHRALPWYKLTVGISLFLLSAALYLQLSAQKGRLLYRARNFYGALSVWQAWNSDMLESCFVLMHGRITHGIQVEQHRKIPTTYFDEKSGAGLALRTASQHAASGVRVGVIGLGAGTLAAYSRPGDVFRFYEINPVVIRLAQGEAGYFTFLKDSPARIEIVHGDARLSLEAEAAHHNFQNFDVLIVDAFNGDSIPIHLLTREAMNLYLAHLRGSNSMIAFHISNLAVDLTPVVEGLAKLYRLNSVLIRTDVGNGVILQSTWILLTRGNSLEAPEIQRVKKVMLGADTYRGIIQSRIWTDDYSNLIGLLGRPVVSTGRR
jgi:spermidine synthase